jgi:hypothetical protein
MAQKAFVIKLYFRASTLYITSNIRLTAGANDGSRTHDLPITNQHAAAFKRDVLGICATRHLCRANWRSNIGSLQVALFGGVR